MTNSCWLLTVIILHNSPVYRDRVHSENQSDKSSPEDGGRASLRNAADLTPTAGSGQEWN
jgi:hypothetical protein